MRDLNGRTAVLTGASRGIGPYIARALAAEGANLVLAARSAADLETLAESLRGVGVRTLAVPTDVADRAALEALVSAAEQEFGGIDLLVNNAGVENTMSYHVLTPDEIERMIRVNLTAPMVLTRLVLPGMLERRRGHIVNMASLAGKSGPAYSEPYGATKAGLIGFTQSLRASYHGTGVSASVICPGFVEAAGMYHDAVQLSGLRAPRTIGTSRPEAVARAVVRAVQKDAPEILVNPGPIRLLVGFGALFPGLAERVLRRMGTQERFRRVAEIRERQQARSP